jgi:hypothetical protein
VTPDKSRSPVTFQSSGFSRTTMSLDAIAVNSRDGRFSMQNAPDRDTVPIDLGQASRREFRALCEGPARASASRGSSRRTGGHRLGAVPRPASKRPTRLGPRFPQNSQPLGVMSGPRGRSEDAKGSKRGLKRDSEPPGHFVCPELRADTLRFLEETKTRARARRAAEQPSLESPSRRPQSQDR